MYTFERTAKYYETDQMGIVHHSNYIRWFEEARIELMNHVGLPYRQMEENGILARRHVQLQAPDPVR